ncbi:hypothetical protein LSO9J_30015 [Candidatus Liberibacter solanacearum]
MTIRLSLTFQSQCLYYDNPSNSLTKSIKSCGMVLIYVKRFCIANFSQMQGISKENITVFSHI